MKQPLIRNRSVLLALIVSGLPLAQTLAQAGTGVAKPLTAARAATPAASAAEQAKLSPYAQANRRRLKTGEPHSASLSRNSIRPPGQIPGGG